MNWDDMRIFLAVAREQSLSGAGRLLRLDPATVGRRVGRLEEDLGVPLFLKTPQGYALTEAGERALEHAERAETALGGVSNALSGDGEALTGAIRLGAPDGCANFLLPQVCARIQSDNPGLDVQVVALPRVFNLTRREADMAIGVSAPTAGRLTVQKIADYRLHLAAHRRYLDRDGRPARLADLRAHRIVGYIPDMVFDKELDYLSETGAERVALACNSVSVQFQWLRQAAGIGIVHDFMLPADPEIVRVLHEALSLTRTFWLIRHEADRRVERLNRFAAALVAGLRAEIARLEAAAGDAGEGQRA
ncbi:LysR family transcriptional regulator [Tranquillimonas rosea]|uniref:LysR family transcriptional regulator n=1 Tax=Tranquillimonas rosea TaxID=641238 RepID=UPI003BABEA52